MTLGVLAVSAPAMRTDMCESVDVQSHPAPSLCSGAAKGAICRGHEEEPGTPGKLGSPLPDLGSVQRLALRLNERIASEERSRSPSPRRSLSLSPSPLVSHSHLDTLSHCPFTSLQRCLQVCP